jgi:Tfp pilus assembly protein PilX
MSTPRSQFSRREEGSAYIVALLVLLVLTVLGLSLALVTQSELQIGANERTIHRIFYGADSGVAVVTARLTVTNDTDNLNKFEIIDPGANPLNLRTRVDACIPVTVAVGHANLSSINEGGAAGGSETKRISYAVTSEATRLAGVGTEAERVPLGRNTISLIMDLSPRRADPKAATGSANEDCVSRLKF